MTLSTMISKCLRLAPGLTRDIVESTIQDSYLQLSRMDWGALKLFSTIHTLSPYTTGTITVASNGIVTGSGTNWTSTYTNCFMKLYYSDAIFRIAEVNSPTSLTLADWTGETLSTPTTYSIYKPLYSLSSDYKLVTDVVYQTTLVRKSQHDINLFDPGRTCTGEPLWWAPAGLDSNGNLQIEIYPLPDATYPLRVYGKRKISPLSLTDTPILPEDLIEAHALVSLFRMKANQQPRAGWEERLQEQLLLYKSLLDECLYEDYHTYSTTPAKVKDYSSLSGYPESDTFWASHDIE